MELLKSALRTVFASARGGANARAEAAVSAVDREPVPGHGQSVSIRTSGVQTKDQPPAWRLLGSQTGVQDMSYGDMARPIVRHLFAHTPRRLLDIGCASGAVAGGLKESDPALWAWGCELNAQAADVAASRLDHVTRTAREAWSAEDVARVGTVDTVLLLDVLEHMYNPWAELEFLRQNLPADAQVIVSLPNVGHVSVLECMAEGYFPYSALGILDVTHVRFFTLNEMRAMFEQTGFDIEDTWVLTTTAGEATPEFPVQVDTGKLQLRVDSLEEWQQIHAIQFGFRLRPAARA